MPKPTETQEQAAQREYRERTKNVSADRLMPYETHALRVAITELSANIGKRLALVEDVLIDGLAAIALAASTPEDNSAAVKEAIEKLRAASEPLKEAVARNQPPK